jgi:hypothetical protein
VQLASALTWQDSVGQEIVVATFDRQLWDAAARTGLKPWPEKLPAGTTESGTEQTARRSNCRKITVS